MKLFKIVNGFPVPYTLEQFRKENSHTAFGKVIPASRLAQDNIYWVHEKPKPEVTINEKLVLSPLPVQQEDGSWAFDWSIESYTEEEAREWRDQELQDTDWIVPVTDHPKHAEYLAYRQALRDWPATEDFPEVKPELG
jgi:hypothetical protein